VFTGDGYDRPVHPTDTFAVPVGDDGRLLAGLLAKEAAGFNAVYAGYAGRLYDYALGMLGDEVAAEDAVLDALLVAVDRVGRLRDRQRFGVWLYALARNECLRQLRRVGHNEAVRPEGEQRTIRLNPSAGGSQPTRLQAAVATLDPGGREALDLTLRHSLTETQLGIVLGVSTRRAAVLAARARSMLKEAYGPPQPPRHGTCAALEAQLEGWDGAPSRAVHDLVALHLATCQACAVASRGEPPPVEQFAALPAEPLPPHLQSQVLKAATVPSRVSARGEIAEPFQRSGFPVPLDQVSGRRGPLFWLAVAVAALLALILTLTLGGFIFRPAPSPRFTEDPTAGPVLATSLGPPSPVATTQRPAPPSALPTTAAPLPRPPAASPSRKPPAAPAPRDQRKGNAAGRGTGRPAQVDPLFADATVGCPPRWRGTATAFVRFNRAERVTFLWGTDGNPSRRIPMRRVQETIYQADVTGLPLDTTVFWRVVAITVDGARTVTPVATARHDNLC
jgi:RNA polymerase sigma factor (sigma-70 family)